MGNEMMDKYGVRDITYRVLETNKTLVRNLKPILAVDMLLHMSFQDGYAEKREELACSYFGKCYANKELGKACKDFGKVINKMLKKYTVRARYKSILKMDLDGIVYDKKQKKFVMEKKFILLFYCYIKEFPKGASELLAKEMDAKRKNISIGRRKNPK